MEYSTGNTHLLSAILTTATKKSTWQFANDTIGRPARLHARALAAGSAGHLLRRQRHAADAATDARVRPAVSRSRTRSPSRRRVGGTSPGTSDRSGAVDRTLIRAREAARTGATRNTGTGGGSASWADIARTTRGASVVSTSSSFPISSSSSSRRPHPPSPRTGAAIGGTCSISSSISIVEPVAHPTRRQCLRCGCWSV